MVRWLSENYKCVRLQDAEYLYVYLKEVSVLSPELLKRLLVFEEFAGITMFDNKLCISARKVCQQ